MAAGTQSLEPSSAASQGARYRCRCGVWVSEAASQLLHKTPAPVLVFEYVLFLNALLFSLRYHGYCWRAFSICPYQQVLHHLVFSSHSLASLPSAEASPSVFFPDRSAMMHSPLFIWESLHRVWRTALLGTVFLAGFSFLSVLWKSRALAPGLSGSCWTAAGHKNWDLGPLYMSCFFPLAALRILFL